MAINRFSHSGTKSGVYSDIPANAEFQISGTGSVTIEGKCGRGAKIIKMGTGNLYIKGDVEENVAFTISGTGDTKFTKRPPQSVLNLIRNSGVGSISMPGGLELKTAPVVSSSTFIINGMVARSSATPTNRPTVTRETKSTSSSSSHAPRTSGTAGIHIPAGSSIYVRSGEVIGSGSVTRGQGAIVGDGESKQTHTSSDRAHVDDDFDYDVYANQFTSIPPQAEHSAANVTIIAAPGSSFGNRHVSIPANSIIGERNHVSYHP